MLYLSPIWRCRYTCSNINYSDDDAALPPGAQAISVTEEEREAIERVSPFRDL